MLLPLPALLIAPDRYVVFVDDSFIQMSSRGPRSLSRAVAAHAIRLRPAIDVVLRLLMPHGDEQRLELAGAS
jgi:hypothetical protein